MIHQKHYCGAHITCMASPGSQSRPLLRRRDVLSVGMAALLATSGRSKSPRPPQCLHNGEHRARMTSPSNLDVHAGAHATGLESIELPALPQTPEAFKALTRGARERAAAAEDAFLSSDFLQDLKAKSDQNRDQCAL